MFPDEYSTQLAIELANKLARRKKSKKKEGF
jgi:hypothetical protein